MSRNAPQRRNQHQANLPNPRHVREDIVQWEGPVPPPQVIEAYDRLVPGSAQIMWSNFDEQSRHRRSLEDRVVGNSETRANRGQWIAAALIALALTFGLVIALTVSPTAGAGVIVAVMVSGAAIFIAGGRQQSPKTATEEGSSDG